MDLKFNEAQRPSLNLSLTGRMDGHLFIILTFLNLWWIAMWGIVFIAVEYVSGKSKMIELAIYISMMIVILLYLRFNPHLTDHMV